MGIYAPGETVEIYTDLMPSSVIPLPPGVPHGRMLRTLVTARALTVMWQSPAGEVGRIDLEMTAEQTAGASYTGGTVGEYQVGRAGGCGCQGKRVKAATPFPDNRLTPAPRAKQAERTYGVPPNTRFTVRRRA